MLLLEIIIKRSVLQLLRLKMHFKLLLEIISLANYINVLLNFYVDRIDLLCSEFFFYELIHSTLYELCFY